MVFNPPVSKECKYCGRHLDKCFMELGVCQYCLDNYGEDEYIYSGTDDSWPTNEDYY